MLSGARMQVWGDPIDHTLSPRLHAAAYRALGVDWTYRARRIGRDDFSRALAGLTPQERGLSLTMPLKGLAYAAADRRDRHAELTGAVNTLVRDRGGWAGWNTDVGGIMRDVSMHDLADVATARIVGAGATATSALIALIELGVRHIEVAARRPEPAAALAELGTRWGADVRAQSLASDARYAPVTMTIAALAGGVHLPDDLSRSLAEAGGTLYEVVYRPWPTALAHRWEQSGGEVVRGIGMLTEQALLQVRAFVSADPAEPLPEEDAVHAAMVDAVTDV